MKRKVVCLLMIFIMLFCGGCKPVQKPNMQIGKSDSSYTVSEAKVLSSLKSVDKKHSVKLADFEDDPSRKDLIKSQQKLFEYVKNSLDTLAEQPDKFPLRDHDMYGKKKIIYDAVIQYYSELNAGLQEDAKNEGGKSICQPLRVEDITNEFREKYGNTQEYTPNSYYCKVTQILVDLSANGVLDTIQEDPRELAVFITKIY